MNPRTSGVVTGFFLGVLFPLVCFAGYAKYRFPDVPLQEIAGHVKSLGLTGAMLSLCVFANLAVFFFSLWRQKERIARGILAATLAYAVLVAVIKLTG
jgi:hypothetical protein